MVEMDQEVTAERHIAEEIVLHMTKSAKTAAGKITSNLFAGVVVMINNHSCSRPKKGQKSKLFNEINEEKNESMDDLADQVQSLFYHYVHFNSINTLRLNAKLQE